MTEGFIHDNKSHEYFMAFAIEEAYKAASINEVPIGAVVVKDSQIIAAAHNRREIDRDPLAHAEILAIKQASEYLNSWRLLDCTLYVTLEPCPMCAGAIIQSRIPTLVYGTADPKAGCVGSLMNLLDDTRFNHQPQIITNVLQEECSRMLKDFFRALRQK